MTEYRSAGGVGSFMSFFKCCIEGGRDCVLTRFWDGCLIPDFGFVARRLFSCSNLASSRAVHYHISRVRK